MTRPVVISPAAELDLADAVDWYESLRPGLSADFRLDLEAVLSRVAWNPGTYPVLHRDLRRALLHRFPHGLFYRHQGGVHRRPRLPGRLRNRA